MKNSVALLFVSLAAAGASVFAAEPDLSKLPPAAKRKGVTYAKDIHPMLEGTCFRCHGPEKQKGGLRLDSLEAILKGGEDGKIVTAGKSDKSPLVIAIAQIDDEKAMPPKPKPGQFGRGPGGPGGPGGAPGGPPGGGRGGFGPPKPLTSEQIGLVRAWIDQGAR